MRINDERIQEFVEGIERDAMQGYEAKKSIKLVEEEIVRLAVEYIKAPYYRKDFFYDSLEEAVYLLHDLGGRRTP